MLPPFIIEQIRQREERERRKREDSQPRLELPIERFPQKRKPNQGGPVSPGQERHERRERQEHEDEDDPNRGVIILDIV